MSVSAVVSITLLLFVVAVPTALGNVAFTAVLQEDNIVAKGEVVVFSNVITNQGSGYNSFTGVFTAPKGGIYNFNVNALTISGKDFWIDIYHNDDYVISAFGRQNGDYSSGGNSVVLRLRTSDTVYVKARRTAHLYGRANDIYSAFTGFLVNDRLSVVSESSAKTEFFTSPQIKHSATEKFGDLVNTLRNDSVHNNFVHEYQM